ALEKMVKPSGIFWYMYCGYSLLKAPRILTCQNLIHTPAAAAKGPQIQSKIVRGPNVCDNCGFP
ncbi:hypothetical protein, partial [Variovorax paradoxus]|uniref:hypothetical protein n=1 Tax=Variovorax paradoxus TaxID=34073 RepID=UPI003F519C16